MKAETLYQRLAHTFQPDTCTEVFPVIGLQADNAEEIRRVYTATFASPQVFRQLEELDERDCLLFTHHPCPQRERTADRPPRISEEWLAFLRQRRISLFSYHIPLDRNGPFSPGNSLARAVGASPYDTFYEQNQVRMGVLCTSPYATVTDLADGLSAAVGHRVKVYPYGDASLSLGRFAVMAGGAKSTEIYEQLAAYGVNTFITGVTNPETEWVARIHEAARTHRINLVGGTHYSTEKFAVLEMLRYFRAMGLEAAFLPETPRMVEL